MRPIPLLLACSALACGWTTAPAATSSPGDRSVITIEVTRKNYDYFQPWNKRVDQLQKAGAVIGAREILTTADHLSDRTMIRLQKGGRGKWWRGELIWVDYHANLALMKAVEEDFWKGLAPVSLEDPVPAKGSVQIVRWRNGTLENRKAEINRLVVKPAKLSFIESMQMELDSEMNALGWSEPVLHGGKLAGLCSAKEENTCTVIPSSFIRSTLEARRKGNYRGLGYFAFVWQRSENPALHQFLKLPGDPRGVVVISVPSKPGEVPALKPRDIILQIDGFDIDTQGDYKDPLYGNLMLESLATRNKWAGDDVRLKVWREGQFLDVSYRLPKAEFNVELVPQQVFDQEPEYVMLGGLVFQPLSEPFLRSWGNDWKRRAPFRLMYYGQEKATPERPALIILSTILPDPLNLGYQDVRYLAVERMNGTKIRELSDLIEAKDKAVNGFHVLEFRDGEALRRMILDAGELDDATRRVLVRYGIENDHVLSKPLPAKKELKAARAGGELRVKS